MKNQIKSLCFGLALTLLFQPIGNAQITFEFQEGVNGYSGTADTFFLTGDPVRIVGDAVEWEWDGSDAGGFNVGALRFDNIIGDGPNQIPAGSTVVEAFLTLTITNSGSADQIATVHELLKPFDEDADFIDFTANFEPVAGDDFKEDVIAEIPGPTSGDIIQVDVTASLERWVAGEDENLGWLFFPGGSNGVGVQSSEAAEIPIPTLVIDTPEGTFQFRDGENGYDGTVDTFVNTADGAAEVFGERDNFEWDGDDMGGSNFGLLRFDGIFGSGSNQIPPGTTINSAQVILFIQDGGSTASMHEILEGSENEPTDFDNTTTTMLDFGDSFVPRAGVDYAEEPVVAEVPGEVGVIELDVTSSIQKYSGGEENRGWIIVPGGGGGVEAVSSEASSEDSGPPKLTVIIEGEDTKVEDYMLHE